MTERIEYNGICSNEPLEMRLVRPEWAEGKVDLLYFLTFLGRLVGSWAYSSSCENSEAPKVPPPSNFCLKRPARPVKVSSPARCELRVHNGELEMSFIRRIDDLGDVV
jgi:hypothetical protein